MAHLKNLVELLESYIICIRPRALLQRKAAKMFFNH